MEKKLILGPPGTGKTTTLLDIVSDLIDKGVPPQKIAYVSFTKKAAEEAITRARKKFSLPKSDFPNFRTLHSLAFRELGLTSTDVMQPNHWQDINELTGRRLDPYKFSDGIGNNDIISFHLHLSKAMCRSYEEHFRTVAGSLAARKLNFGSLKNGGSLAEFVKLGEYIDSYKSEAALVDYSDMLSMASHCDPLDIDYAIIDEAQDLSRLQWKFCKSIFRQCETVWVAGDDDQAIYSWAGADLYTFRHMDAERTVLEHSWRLPRAIWRLANGIVDTIDDRYKKDWGPRDEEGSFEYVAGLSDCPLDNGETWYLLTRTRSLQQNMVHYLRAHGYTYLKQSEETGGGRHSVKHDHLRMAKAWTRLTQGEKITAAQARLLYQNMRDDQIQRGALDKLNELEPEQQLRMPTLVKEYGLKVQEGVWHDVLVIDRMDSQYYKAVKERFGTEALTDTPKIQISTIHGVKGGEADNVYFSNSMGQRCNKNYKAGYTRDDEARIFYVAATRARKRLFVKPSLQCSFPLPRM